METTASTASLASVTLEVADHVAAHRFYTAFGVDTRVCPRASDAHSSGFRGFSLALTVSQPATVDSFLGAAVDAGATVLKPAAKSLRTHLHHRVGEAGRPELFGGTMRLRRPHRGRRRDFWLVR